jgi:hypothetical protein
VATVVVVEEEVTVGVEEPERKEAKIVVRTGDLQDKANPEQGDLAVQNKGTLPSERTRSQGQDDA